MVLVLVLSSSVSLCGPSVVVSLFHNDSLGAEFISSLDSTDFGWCLRDVQ